ncbi:MAG: GNAT family N-acetyltransferase, partial [Maritimibacter sp.]|nr:GNAT family N-acetyltransferase [Maritimibacter sp.]
MFETARYRVRLAATAADLARAQALRARLFRGATGGSDADRFDHLCRHLLVEDRDTGAVVCTCRLLELSDGSRIGESYSAQFYELAALGGFAGRMVEIGRFCIAPEARDTDVLRLAWAALTRMVEAEGIELLFGCSSFPGTDAEAFRDAFALLAARYMAPRKWLPRVKAPEVVRFARVPRGKPDLKRAQKTMPPLLRTYLAMGGWVSDHAVRDRDLGTLHVFTGLEVGQVPP